MGTCDFREVRPHQTICDSNGFTSAPIVRSVSPPYGPASSRSTLRYLSSRDLSSLGTFVPTASAKSKAVIDATLRPLPWIEKGRSFFDNELLAIDNVGSSSPGYPTHYGGDIMPKWSNVAMFLNLNHSLANKDYAINQTIQCGLDIMEYFKNGGVLEMSISHKQGRGFPVYFAAVVMNDSDCQALVNDPGKLPENRVVWQVTADDVGRSVNSPRSSYQSSHIGMYEWGQEHYSQPYLDDADWGPTLDSGALNAFEGRSAPTIRSNSTAYRYNTGQHGGTYFAVLAMNPEAWGHEPFRGYMKRFKGVTGWSGGEADELFAAYGSLLYTEKPSFSVATGTICEPSITVSMSVAAGTIHYTVDGSTPDDTDSTYSAPVSVAPTMKAINYNSSAISGVATANYTVITNGTPAPPTNLQFVP